MEAVVVGNYVPLLIPAIVALILLFLVLRVVGAILKLIMLIVLVAVLVGGYLLYGRINALETAVNAAAGQTKGGVVSVGQVQGAVQREVADRARQLGLDPAYLQVRVSCSGTTPEVHLTYTDQAFIFGILNNHDFTVQLSHNVRCG